MKTVLKRDSCRHCVHEYDKEYQIENTDQLLCLIQVYLSEWTHRDSLLWKQIFTYFFATMVVTILPFINLWEISFDSIVPDWIFPTLGLFMSLAFFVIGKGYAVRLTAAGITYNNLLQKLPKEYRRIKLNDLNPNSLSNVRMAYFIVYLMSFLLTALAVALLVISIT